MTKSLRVAAFVLALSLVAASSAIAAAPEPLLGNGCYFIPSERMLVKVLVGAEEVEGGLVSELTSGEVWFLKTFFGLETTVVTSEEHIAACLPTMEK